MSEGLAILVPPAAEPVTLAEARLHLRVDHSEEDSLIASLIEAARVQVESDTRRALVARTLKLTLDAFPAGAIVLPCPPFQSIVSPGIQYRDPAGVLQTLAASSYVVDAASEPGRIAPAVGQAWPATISELAAVAVTFTAGYGSALAVPATYKAMIKLLLGHWYERREASIVGTIIAEVPLAYERLVNSARPGRYV